MKTFLKVLKFAGCLYGGVVAASVAFLAGTMAVFGLNGGEPQVGVIERWILFVWILGAAFGGWIAYRSERRARA